MPTSFKQGVFTKARTFSFFFCAKASRSSFPWPCILNPNLSEELNVGVKSLLHQLKERKKNFQVSGTAYHTSFSTQTDDGVLPHAAESHLSNVNLQIEMGVIEYKAVYFATGVLTAEWCLEGGSSDEILPA